MRRREAVRAWFATHWPKAVVVAAPAVLFWQLLFTGRVLFWGLPLLQFYPWRWLALQQIRAGELPLWNPYLGSGAPLLANYQTGVLYPPNWLGFLPGIPLDYSLGLIAILHIAWAGVGMVLFARAFGLGPLGQAVAGLGFSLSGYLVGRLTFLTIIAAAAWLPWLLLAAERLIQTSRAPSPDSPTAPSRQTLRAWVAPLVPWLGPFLALAGIMDLQLLAGHAQTTFYSLLLTGSWIVWRGWRLAGWRGTLRLLVVFGVAGAFALALAAAQLLPTAELLRQSARAGEAGYDFVVTYSYWPWRLLTLFAPDAFGNPAHGDYWGYGNYWEDAAYVGLLPLGLALMAFLAWRRARRSARIGPSAITNNQSPVLDLVPFLLIVAVVALILAMGQNTPVFPFFYRFVPSFNQFQAPARMMLAFVWAVALLAGIGADHWRRPGGTWRAWTSRGVAAGLGVALAAIATGFATASSGLAQALPVFETMPRALALAGFIGAAAFVLSLVRPFEGGPRWQAAVVAFVALDLIAAGYWLNPAVDPRLYRDQTASGPVLRDWLAGKRLYQFEADEYDAKYKHFFRFDTYGPLDLDYWRPVREAQMPNLALLEGIASANNFNPLIPARYEELLQAVNTAEPAQALALLRSMGVQAVISAQPPPGLTQIYAGDGFGVYAVPQPAERVRIAYSLQAAARPEQSLAYVSHPRFDPGVLAVVESPELAAPYRQFSALCRSGLFDGLERNYTKPGFGGIVISGQAICQYYSNSALYSFNRGVSALANISQAAGFGSPAGTAEDVLGPFEALGNVPAGQPVLLTDSPTHIRIAAPMEFSGYLILADTYYPGWRAYVDGERVEIVPADHAFRAVFLPAGQHIVEFRYQPGTVQVGGLLSGLAWLAFAALAGVARLGRPQRNAAPA